MTAVSLPTRNNFDVIPSRAPARPFPRTQYPRPHLRRNSPLSSVSTVAHSLYLAPGQHSVGDSSDDETSAPLLSAEAEEILGVKEPKREEQVSKSSNIIAYSDERGIATGSPLPREHPEPLNTMLRQWTVSPSAAQSGSPRIVRLRTGSTGSATLRRTMSASSVHGQSPAPVEAAADWETPAPRPRQPITGATGSDSAGARTDSHPSDLLDSLRTDRGTEQRPLGTVRSSDAVRDSAVQMGSLTINRVKREETGSHGSLRITRVGKVAGRYLSGPARRGMIRRHSDEEQSPLQEEARTAASSRSSSKADVELSQKQQRFSEASPGQQGLEPHTKLDTNAHDAKDYAGKSEESHLHNSDRQNSMGGANSIGQVNSSIASDRPQEPVFKIPFLPALPSRFDQENEPPPTFKRNKPNVLDFVDKPHKMTVMVDEKPGLTSLTTASPPRKVLGPRSQNTPHRPAPPPPKMTVLETATATAGAASASQKKKKSAISVNGKLFTRLDCIGRGGSARVYRVMAENHKIFALKRVSLEDVDELAIRGYKGEIELLKKLENVDRVVRLFDYEINDERQTLSILMEMGESDLNRVLTLRLNAENAKFDVSFTRYIWKEMVECVQAVHQHDIVHSDLKPANFLLVQGRLKLIDFGIANAIQDDTVNVHREQQIGTPNYMSPEALLDSNAAKGLPSTVGKLMKLGKPSDVWSLGCILYQMVYGKPPFAHITNQMHRIMAIPNPSHVIQYPDTGVGGGPVALGLVRTLRMCLNRDLIQRPSVEELLSDTDPFLNPDAQIQGTVPVSEELLARLQHNIIKHIRERGMPSDAELSTWPAKFFTSIKAAVEEGRA